MSWLTHRKCSHLTECVCDDIVYPTFQETEVQRGGYKPYTLNLPGKFLGDPYCSTASQTLTESLETQDYVVESGYLANDTAI